MEKTLIEVEVSLRMLILRCVMWYTNVRVCRNKEISDVHDKQVGEIRDNPYTRDNYPGRKQQKGVLRAATQVKRP